MVTFNCHGFSLGVSLYIVPKYVEPYTGELRNATQFACSILPQSSQPLMYIKYISL